MQPSPNLFPSLQFSPDIFSHSPYGPATAPLYPQQRLFWDTNMATEDPTGLPQYQDPYGVSQADFSTSFNSSSTIVPTYMPVSLPQQQHFDMLPVSNAVPPNYMDGAAFPAPFTTSPRAPPPREDNPSMFLSSPARRFGNDQRTSYPVTERVREIPAYHHQIEESRREQEAKRSRKVESRQPSITRSVMEALRRPISPLKNSRPGLRRSLTHSGAGNRGPHNRQQSHVSFLDTASTVSGSTNRSRGGRTSPLKTMQKAKRTSLSLAIDENGRARTVVVTKPDDDDDMDIDESDATSDASSRDETDFNDLRSQPNSFAIVEEDEERYPSRNSMRSLKGNRHSGSWQPARSGLQSSRTQRGPRPLSMIDSMSGVGRQSSIGDAQQALRAIIEDRGQHATTNDDSLGSGKSAQFNSSPPMHQAQFANYNPSPTTITDPDLATPSTDRGSQASHSSTRCLCGMMQDDVPGIMLQW
jgi:hypothetical protein